MSARLPVLKPREVIRALEKAGWYIHRQRGSHLIMHKRSSKNLVIIPMHSRDIPKGTLSGILNDVDLSVEEFMEFLRK
jgi:predicted RNA binding protein YcfA (HicA-like mRNA interferase family)